MDSDLPYTDNHSASIDNFGTVFDQGDFNWGDLIAQHRAFHFLAVTFDLDAVKQLVLTGLKHGVIQLPNAKLFTSQQ